MGIITKFKINSLIKHKFQKELKEEDLNLDRNTVKFFEVLYIHTETCSAGTQIFYLCRPFFPLGKEYAKPVKLLDIGLGFSTQTDSGLIKFREDEIIELGQSEKQLFGVN